jgi:hypothetical protein
MQSFGEDRRRDRTSDGSQEELKFVESSGIGFRDRSEQVMRNPAAEPLDRSFESRFKAEGSLSDFGEKRLLRAEQAQHNGGIAARRRRDLSKSTVS